MNCLNRPHNEYDPPCSICDASSSRPALFRQPESAKNDSTPIVKLLIEDVLDRDRIGRAKYGTSLQAGNGRDPLVDAYQEALDLAFYLRQAIAERGAR